MIEDSKMQGILDLFGPELPSRHLFFATRQTYPLITPGLIKSAYHELTLAKAYHKFKIAFDQYVIDASSPIDEPSPPEGEEPTGESVVKEQTTPLKPVPAKVIPPVVTKDVSE